MLSLTSGTTSPMRPAAAHRIEAAAHLPAWPVAAMLVGYPIWWLLGFVDFAWIIFGAVMALYLAQTGSVRVPRGFGLWLAFLVWMTLTAIRLDAYGRLVAFTYRHLTYLAATVLFVYVYNARRLLHDRAITGLLLGFWGITVFGGFLGMWLPTATVRTPLSYVLPRALLDNELVGHMAIRRFAQYDADGWVQVAPRPSAPFLYTNNWGNVYSFLLPFVVLKLIEWRGTRRFPLLLAAIVASFVPAAATLNRGMFLGLGVAALYLGVRYLLLGRPAVLLCVAAVGLVGALAFVNSPWNQEFTSRVEDSGTTEARAEIYRATLASAADSPLLGMGGPRPNPNPNIPPVGSHGQFWIVLHSHGVPGVLLFMGWFTLVVLRSLRRTDHLGLVANAVVLVGLMESLYYGFLPTGMMVLSVVAALALRPPSTGHEYPPVNDPLPNGHPSHPPTRLASP